MLLLLLGQGSHTESHWGQHLLSSGHFLWRAVEGGSCGRGFGGRRMERLSSLNLPQTWELGTHSSPERRRCQCRQPGSQRFPLRSSHPGEVLSKRVPPAFLWAGDIRLPPSITSISTVICGNPSSWLLRIQSADCEAALDVWKFQDWKEGWDRLPPRGPDQPEAGGGGERDAVGILGGRRVWAEVTRGQNIPTWTGLKMPEQFEDKGGIYFSIIIIIQINVVLRRERGWREGERKWWRRIAIEK